MPAFDGTSAKVVSVPPAAAEHGAGTDHSQDSGSHLSPERQDKINIKLHKM